MRNLVIQKILGYYKDYPELESWTGVGEAVLNYLSNKDLLEHLEDCITTLSE